MTPYTRISALCLHSAGDSSPSCLIISALFVADSFAFILSPLLTFLFFIPILLWWWLRLTPLLTDNLVFLTVHLCAFRFWFLRLRGFLRYALLPCWWLPILLFSLLFLPTLRWWLVAFVSHYLRTFRCWFLRLYTISAAHFPLLHTYTPLVMTSPYSAAHW